MLLLVMQAAFTIVAVEQLRRRVFNALHQFSQPALIVDVWAPIAIVLPMMFWSGRIENSMAGAGWVVVGAPAMCALFAFAAALIVLNGANRIGVALRSVVIWSAAGLLMLLLGAAHDLTMVMGQCAFGAAALLLWINTPDEAIYIHHDPSSPQARAGFGMTIALMAAIGQGMTAFFINPPFAAISGAMMIAGAAMAISSAARLAGPNVTIRLGGWAATYGILFGLGLLSLLRLLPHSWAILFDGQRSVPLTRIAYGFGEYWIEAVIVLVFGGAAFVLPQVPRSVRKFVGMIFMVAAAVLAGWRLSRL